MPTTSPDDWRDSPVSVTLHCALRSHQWTQPNSCYPGPSGLPSPSSSFGYSSRLQCYCHSVGWADDPTCPDYHAADNTAAYLFSCPTHPTHLALVGYVGGIPPDCSFPGGPPTACRSASIISLLYLQSRQGPIPLLGPQRDHFNLLLSSFTLISTHA